MSLFGFKEKKEIARLKEQMTPDQIKLSDIQGEIEKATSQLEHLTKKLEKKKAQLEKVKEQIIETDEAANLQSFGFYTPHYQYTVSDEYKEKIAEIRAAEKKMIHDKTAVTGSQTWTVNGNKSKGAKMVHDMQKLLLRAFNAECDDAIEHVKFNNLKSCEKKITTSYDAISKLGEMMQITIAGAYYSLKMNELDLVYEYQLKKQEEKDELKAARERLREEAKLAKEIEEARKKLEKEQSHYSNALAKINAQIETANESERIDLEAKKSEIMQRLETIEQDFKDVDYREANQRAGYVYVISNIGAFGEDVYKIGMTRRLDPMDRVDELGDASVPFNFDVHAMIFTEDAPGLEAALHQAFADRKLNFINTRREFFNVTLDEIKEVVRANYDKTVEFVDIPAAEQYRETMALKKSQDAVESNSEDMDD